MQQTLLSELKQFIADLKQKETATFYTIPDEIMGAVKKAKNLEKFIHEIFNVVNGSGGIDISNIVRREFGMSKELTDRIDQWAPYSKEQFVDALHDAVDRMEIRAGKRGLFFEGSPDKKEMTEALRLLKGIAHAAVTCQFNPRLAGPEVYVEILENLIRFYSLPNAFPSSHRIKYRNLIPSSRLNALSGNHETITAALKAHAKEWYQTSPFTFLEDREWYPGYEYVHYYLYILTGEQLERLRNDFILYAGDEFKLLKAKPELHRAEYLEAMLESVLGWTVDES
ncbi:MAG: hypothetical protein K0S39_5056 [Paenibacillus sp.]|jgi:hypothetical protein|nr:hypothetical protein [Paenibacillus sp.]